MSTPALRHPATPERELIPKVLLRAMGALVLSALAIVAYARIADVPLSATPPASPVAQERAMVLVSDGVSGAVTVLSREGSLIAKLDAETGGFVAGVARVIELQRRQAKVAAHSPVLVTRGTNGRLMITDPSTGWRADLMGFGADNARSFARLLDQP